MKIKESETLEVAEIEEPGKIIGSLWGVASFSLESWNYGENHKNWDPEIIAVIILKVEWCFSCHTVISGTDKEGIW